jgi:hypothetical protein
MFANIGANIREINMINEKAQIVQNVLYFFQCILHHELLTLMVWSYFNDCKYTTSAT